MNDKISVIIPFHNVEKYLAECLDSVIHQSYGNLEILCIDDGSTDSSPVIVQRYADADPRIRIVTNRTNLGISRCRNLGLDICAGSCVIFVDSDDSIDECYVEGLAEALEREATDWSYNPNIRVVRNDKSFSYAYSSYRKKESLRITKPTVFLDDVSTNVWGKLFRTRFIRENNIRFPDEILAYTDVLFAFSVSVKAPVVAMSSRGCYHYRKRERSITFNALSKLETTLVIFDVFEKIRFLDSRQERPLFAYHKQLFARFLPMNTDKLKNEFHSRVSALYGNMDRNYRRGLCLQDRIVFQLFRYGGNQRRLMLFTRDVLHIHSAIRRKMKRLLLDR